MIGWLLLLQWPLVVLPAIFLGAAIHGYAEGTTTANAMLTGLFSLPFVHLAIERFDLGASRRAGSVISLALAGLALAVYRPLHLGYWNERSLAQAFTVVAFGLLSFALAHVGAARVRRNATERSQARTAGTAAAVLGVAWLGWWSYPFSPLLVAALVGLMHFGHTGARGAARRPRAAQGALGRWLIGFGIALLELTMVAWDRQLDSSLGVAFALGTLGAAAGLVAVQWVQESSSAVGLCLLWSVLALSLLVPGFVIRPEHALLAGAAAGLFLGHGLGFDGALRPRAALWATLAVVLAYLWGILIGANQAFVALRGLFWLLLIPWGRLRASAWKTADVRP